MRTGGRVMPLELFFDLVFVLGLTQCTALMADEPTWEGLVKGLLVARGAVVGVGGLRVADERRRSRRRARCGSCSSPRWRRCSSSRSRSPRPSRTTGCCSPAASPWCGSRTSSLFPIASRDDPDLRSSVTGLAISTALGVGHHRGRVVHRRRAAGWRSGSSRSCSTWAGRRSSARRAGSSSPSTSPSATG